MPLSAADESSGNVAMVAAADGVWVRVTPSATPTFFLHVNDDGEIDVNEPTEVSAFSVATDGETVYGLGFDGVLVRVGLDGSVEQSGTPIAEGQVVVADGEPYVVAADRVIRVDADQLTAADIFEYTSDGEPTPLSGFDDLDIGPDVFVDGTVVTGVVGGEPSTFFQVDVETGELVNLIELPVEGTLFAVVRMARSDDTFWAHSNATAGVLARIDAQEATVDDVSLGEVEGLTAVQLVGSPEMVALSGDLAGLPTVLMIDPADGELAEQTSSFLWPALPTLAGGDIWITNFATETVTPVDTDGDDVGEPLTSGSGLAREAAGRVAIPTGGGDLLVVDPEDPANPTTIALPQGGLNAVTDGGDQAWVDSGSVFIGVNVASGQVTGTLPADDFVGPVDYPLVAGNTAIAGGRCGTPARAG